MITVDQMLSDPARINARLRQEAAELALAQVVFPSPHMLHRRSGLRLRLYRGVHRANRFSITVADLAPYASRPGWYRDWRGNWSVKMNVRIYGVPAGERAAFSIAPPGGIAEIPALIGGAR